MLLEYSLYSSNSRLMDDILEQWVNRLSSLLVIIIIDAVASGQTMHILISRIVSC